MKATYGRNLIKIKLGLYVRQQPRNKWRSEVIREPLHVGGGGYFVYHNIDRKRAVCTVAVS